MSFQTEGYEVGDDDGGNRDLRTDVSVSADSDDGYERGGKSVSESNGGALASWREVRSFCCWYPNFKAWAKFFLHFFSFFTILYLFFVGIELLASSVQVLGGCYGASLLAENFNNPVTNVMAGIIVTSIFQSSTATNFVIGSLAGNVLTVQQGIYMAMGANVGNTMINSIFALVHVKSQTSLELAMAGASVCDIFYILTILIVLPLEMVSNMLYHISGALTSTYDGTSFRWKGLIETIVTPLTNTMIIANDGITQSIISGDISSCDMKYPVYCEDGVTTFDTCNTGLIACDENTGRCPVFFSDGGTQKGDQVKGVITLVIAIAILILSLYGMMYLIYTMLVATPVNIIARITTLNSYVSMTFGFACGLLLGSSTAPESMLTPFVGVGVIELEQMFPWSLGSNVGFSVSTILIALSTGKEGFVQVALANFFFQVIGIIFWFVIPMMRTFPLHAALMFGILSNNWRFFPLIYVAVTFFAIPFLFIGIIKLTQNSSTGIKAAGYIALSLLVILCISVQYWWFKFDGRDKFLTFFGDNENDAEVADNNSMSDDDGAYSDEETAATGPPLAPVGILRSPSSFGDRVPSIKPAKSAKKAKKFGRNRSVKPVTITAPSEDETTVGGATNPLSFIDLICRLPPGLLNRTGSAVTQLKKGDKKKKKKSKLKRLTEDK